MNKKTLAIAVTANLASGTMLAHSKGKKPPYEANKVMRNDPCPCGSGNKYKKCCKPTHQFK